MTLLGLALAEAVKARARELGFDGVAIGAAGPPPHGGAFTRWLDAGYAGTMEYLARGGADRLDPARLLPACRSAIAVALSYSRGDDAGWDGVARYARGHDYHELMRPRLAGLADFVRSAAGPGTRCRAAVDTSAILERDVAARAGLGWVGKNTNLLAPSLGSYFFIDARRCIAYLTIEHRGDVPRELREGIGEWLFGCDVCQEVCPWNRKTPPGREAALAPAGPLPPLEELLALDDDAFRARFRHTPLWRAKRSGLLRNAAIVLGNRGDARAVQALEKALEDDDEAVRRAAAWALGRIRARAEASER